MRDPGPRRRQMNLCPPIAMTGRRLTYGPVPYVPEVSIFQAPAGTGLWDASGGAYHSDRPPPFWAFPWAGGQALARYILDHPDVVASRTVLDFGAGSGLVGLAAAYGSGRGPSR